MNERTIRFGFSGVTFILSLIFFYWWLGGSLQRILPIKDESKLIEIAISVLSTPVIGFILSSIGTFFVRRLILPNHIEFLKPRDELSEMYLREIVNGSKTNATGIIPNGNSYAITDINRLYLAHTSLFIKRATDEAIKFSSRRIDIYNMHVSTISSIALAFCVSIIIACQNKIFSNSTFDCGKSIWILFFIVYIGSGINQAIKALKQANEFEKIYLINN
jgi:phosphate/sulfate permease